MSHTESSVKKRVQSRPRAPLHASLDKNLNAYVTAACAAGVSMLACAPPAEAKIIYTPANTYILPNSTLHLDLNHDGNPDFLFSNTNYRGSFSRTGHGSLNIKGQNSVNAVWGTGAYASALRAGVRVRPNKHFQSGHFKMAGSRWIGGSNGSSFTSHGPWADVTRRYLGFKFSIKGKLHFGWARLNVTVTYTSTYAVLTGYAYETVPNTPIVTGKTKGAAADVGGAGESAPASFMQSKRPPASLGLLAQGASGLDIWRKRRTATD